MDILPLIFSGPGATIFICITILILVAIYLRFTDKFRGLSLGYKEFKVETPKLLEAVEEPPVEVIQGPTAGAEPKPLEARRPPFQALFDAVERQDRAAIEAAIDEMREDPPFGYSPQELEAFKFSELLSAGFTDAIENLKTIEENDPAQIEASLSLARYYFRTGVYGNAEGHLRIADERSYTDDKKVDVALLRAEILDFTKGKEVAIAFLEEQLKKVGSGKQLFRLFNEIGNLSNATINKSRTITAYEQALRCIPEDIEARFKLALIYGAIDSLKMLGMRHYRIIHQQNHLHTGALHNLGLLYGEFGLPIAKINLIRKAAEQNDGHAIGTLARFYIEGGFVHEAQKIIRDAPKEVALSDRVIAAQQYLRKAEQDNETNREKLVRSAEELSNLVSDYKFAKIFDANKYLGAWVDLKDEKSTFDVENPSGLYGQYKFTLNADGRKMFGYSFLISSLVHIDFSSVDKPPLGFLGMSEGEFKTAVLFGEETVRVIELTGMQIKFWRDFDRRTK